MAIIKSLLDTDLYKLTMMQVALHQFNTTDVEYTFKCRNKANWTLGMLGDINEELDEYCKLRFTERELNYLASLPFIKSNFIDFLRLYQPNRDHINAYIDADGQLQVDVKGPWYLTIPFEVPVLAIVNETYFTRSLSSTELEAKLENGRYRLEQKVVTARSQGFPFADFGTRRRFMGEWQEEVVKTFSKLPNFVGTSNIYLAMKYDLKPIGTMAHEYIMAGAGQDEVRLVKSQSYMLQKWVDEYRGLLGTALTDTYGFDAFLKDFDLYFAKLYDGLRHDSGDPMIWAEKAIAHYESLGIDPMTKNLVFSDGLNMDKASTLWTALKDRAKISFGIGTYLTNDFEGVTPLQIVMKITTCNGHPVAKISDSAGKGMCKDDSYVAYVKKVFKITSKE